MSASGISFVAFDVETANRNRGSICAIATTVVVDGVIEQEKHWLCRPPEALDRFDPFNTRIHGITSDMVQHQPRFDAVWPEVIDAVGHRTVVAHNAAFDTGAIKRACAYSDIPQPLWKYVCTLSLSRHQLDLVSYRLPIVANHLDVDLPRHHDAQHDATAAARILLAIAERNEATSLDDLLNRTGLTFGSLEAGREHGSWKKKGHLTQPEHVLSEVTKDHPLYGETIVFTGGLETMTRQEAWNAIARLGAIPAKGITKKTNFLVIGDGFLGNDAAEFQTRKAQKVQKLREAGQPIEILTEPELLAYLWSLPNPTHE